MTLDQLIDLYTPKVAEAFRAAIADVVDRAVISRVTKAVELGDPVAAFRVLGFDDTAMRPITKALEDAFEAGGIATGATFPETLYTTAGPTVYRFDVRNSRAEKWVREQSAKLVDNITNTARENIRQVMFQNVEFGRNPNTTALDIAGRMDPVLKRRTGGIIGLNNPQSNAVAAMREDLKNLDKNYFTRKRRDKSFDSVVRKMFKEGEVSSKRINRLAQRYSDNLLVLRSETVARDASLEALNSSQHEAFKQAQDLGSIKNIKRGWDSAGPDGVTRASHLYMDAKEPVGLDEPFVFTNGVRVMYPQDRSLPNNQKNLAEETINCRCKVKMVVDWLSELDG